MVLASSETNSMRSRLCRQEETKFLRRFQDSGNFVVHSDMSGSCGCSSQFGARSGPHAAQAGRRARRVCSFAREKRPDGSAGRAGRAEMTDRKGWPKLDGSQRCQVHPGLNRQDPVLFRPSSGERPWPPCFLGCRKAAGPCRSQSRLAGRMVVKRYGMGSKWRRLGERCYAAGHDATLLFSRSCVQLTENERQETDGHISLFFNNLRRKPSFPNFQKNRQT